jgi:endonuclease III
VGRRERGGEGTAVEHIDEIVDILEREYGSQNHGNKEDPLDELIYIKLSQQTNEPKFVPMYEALQRRYPGWQGLERATQEELEAILRPIGFHRQRAANLRALAARIVVDSGLMSLSWLRDVPSDEAIAYLSSLPGIGIKTAYCVAMYSLGCDILPVDVHVQRVSERLGILPVSRSDERKHQLLNEMIPKGKRHSYHVNCVSHGRQVCRKLPRCGQCVVRQFCAYYRAAVSGQEGGAAQGKDSVGKAPLVEK